MDALCRLDYQAASQYCTWKLLETTWKCFVSFWMASAIESLSLLSSLSRCNQNWTHTIMHHAFKTWCIVSTNGRYAMLCNQKRYCTGKPRYHNGFGVFSCPNFQVQTKRYFSLLRGLELPTPTISGGFWEMYSPESRLFSFPLKNYFLRSSLKSKDDLPACSGKRFALHFRANLT